MKILYGVQGTGNGHITRARTMARAFANTAIDVDYVFSGRARDRYFDMDVFGDFRCFRGLSFSWKNGRIDHLRTALDNNVFKFMRDVRAIDLSAYDLVMTDFEPITAWAAKLQKKPSLGLGHQYAFKSNQVPTAGHSVAGELVLKYFAPAQRTLGFHWHHFNSPILPPLIEPAAYPLSHIKNNILVYLPFENKDRVAEFLRVIKDVHFYVYCDIQTAYDEQHIHFRPFNRDAFQQDLASCGGVIANAGFGLLSEAIQAGKKLLVRPMSGQMEQLSNAEAIKALEIGQVMYEFNLKQLREWLSEECPEPRSYPDVAKSIVAWIESGMAVDAMLLAKDLWQDCEQFQSGIDNQTEAACL